MSKHFWIEDISQLFLFKDGIFPNSSLNLVENMNATARISLIACFIIALFKPALAISTFIIATVITIAIFYGLSAKEGFNENVKSTLKANSTACNQRCFYDFPVNPRINSEDPEEFVSENNKLIGGPNPKTLIPLIPAMVTKSYDLEAWKQSDLTVHSGVNKRNKRGPHFYGSSSSSHSGYRGNHQCLKCFNASCTCIYAKAANQKVNINDNDYLPEVEIVSPTINQWGLYNPVDEMRKSVESVESVYNTGIYRGLNSMNEKVNDYVLSTNRSRKDFQESLMKKRNSEMWQLRMAPIY